MGPVSLGVSYVLSCVHWLTVKHLALVILKIPVGQPALGRILKSHRAAERMVASGCGMETRSSQCAKAFFR